MLPKMVLNFAVIDIFAFIMASKKHQPSTIKVGIQ